MNLEKVKQIVEEFLKSESMRLYSIRTKGEHGMSILEISVDGHTLDAAYLGELNQKINDLIDEELPNNYYLEVSSPGAIRPLHSLEEASYHIDKYVLATTDRETYKGVLKKIDLEKEIVSIEVNLKGRFKVFEVPYKEINKFKLTVRF